MKKDKKSTNNVMLNVLRWVALVPVLCVVWWLVVFCGMIVSRYSFMSVDTLWLVVFMLVLPAVAIFFTAHFIAPKYKNIVGWISVLLCVVSFGLFFYGLTHMAY